LSGLFLWHYGGWRLFLSFFPLSLHLNYLNMKKTLFLLLVVLTGLMSNVQSQQVEPPFWWVGMHNHNLQLLVHKAKIAELTPEIKQDGVSLMKVHRTSNPNYLFIDLEIEENAVAGSFNIDFYKDGKVQWSYKYVLLERTKDADKREGFNNSDIIYLLMPDRFANGDRGNDNMPGMLEKADRNNPDGRHGGDIKGIADHLDYLEQLGVTAIWINPLLENNMPAYSYHGYAITDFYKVDPRFGSNQDYVDLVAKAKSKNIKIIMDMVFNHCGINHWWMKDLPTADWVHQFDKFTRSNYRGEALMDPHASANDKMIMSDGWFDSGMPDLNQKEPLLASYLIQNSIWWIEYAGLSGIRMDTYPYADQDFMNRWISSLYEEYPEFNIVGEAWLQTVPHTAYFQSTTFPNDKKSSKLGSVTDFPLCYAANNALNHKDSWTEGLTGIYMTLSEDFVYSNADSNLIFLDNHDINRFATNIHADWDKWKMGMTFLLTTRGIPMIYYGGELMMEGDKSKGDADLRHDFPGGWKGDVTDAFKGVNMTEKQGKALEFTKKLLKYRNDNPILQTGKLTHFIPQNDTYVYFRHDSTTAYMMVMCKSDKPVSLDLSRFSEILDSFSSMKSFKESTFDSKPEQILVSPMSATIYQFK